MKLGQCLGGRNFVVRTRKTPALGRKRHTKFVLPQSDLNEAVGRSGHGRTKIIRSGCKISPTMTLIFLSWGPIEQAWHHFSSIILYIYRLYSKQQVSIPHVAQFAGCCSGFGAALPMADSFCARLPRHSPAQNWLEQSRCLELAVGQNLETQTFVYSLTSLEVVMFILSGQSGSIWNHCHR